MRLHPDLTNAEAAALPIDFLANGVKLRHTNAGQNAASGEFIFLAFAEHPFKYARAF
jgi:hypothetical protein